MVKQFVILGLLLLTAAYCSADDDMQSSSHRIVVYREYSVVRPIGLEPFVEVGVGLLAFVLFIISALAYYRERRTKFLAVCIAFFLFAVKGLLGVLDIVYPTDSTFLLPFAALLDFIILLLLVIAVMKD